MIASNVTIESGTAMGALYNGMYVFKGIPYARAERFMPPTKVTPWAGVRPALVFGETCPNGQARVNAHEFMTPSNVDMVPNESCLSLNVWTSSLKAGASKPVIFWIHGGGFSSGLIAAGRVP